MCVLVLNCLLFITGFTLMPPGLLYFCIQETFHVFADVRLNPPYSYKETSPDSLQTCLTVTGLNH